MADSSRPARLRAQDILRAIHFCETRLAGVSLEAFLADDMKQLAVERALEIVSEASRHLPDDFKAAESAVPWRQVADFGNFTRHAYHTVDKTLVYRTATEEIGPVKEACVRLYARIKEPEDLWPDEY